MSYAILKTCRTPGKMLKRKSKRKFLTKQKRKVLQDNYCGSLTNLVSKICILMLTAPSAGHAKTTVIAQNMSILEKMR